MSVRSEIAHMWAQVVLILTAAVLMLLGDWKATIVVLWLCVFAHADEVYQRRLAMWRADP